MTNPGLIFSLALSLLATCRVLAQDTIIFENKYPYLVEVQEESETRVIYRKYPPEHNLAYIIEKRFITDIRYQDPQSAKEKFKPDTLTIDNKLELWVDRGAPGGPIIRGMLHRLDDSTLILKKKPSLFDKPRDNAPEVVYIFPYTQIHHLAVRRQNKIINFGLGGAAAGFLLGTVTGLVAFNNTPPCDPVAPGMPCDPSLQSPRSYWEKSLTLGFGMAGLGAVAGGIVGGIKVQIPIGGKRDLFNAAIPRINRLDRSLR